MNTKDYINQAQRVADDIGLSIEFLQQPNRCPEKDRQGAKSSTGCPLCGTVHGHCYRVTISRKNDKRRRIDFDYWASFASSFVEGSKLWDNAPLRRQVGVFIGQIENGKVYPIKHTPSVYDILSMVSSDLNMPTEADDVAREFGDGMLPSQCEAIAKFARQLQAFFTEDERNKLAEVQ